MKSPQHLLQRAIEAIAWRIRHLVGDRRLDDALIRWRRLWRPFVASPAFVGIAGSGGKTSAKELLHGILSAHQRGTANPGTMNVLPEVAKTVLRVRPWHQYCIGELSEHQAGVMNANMGLFQPRLGIVTVVREVHLAAFETREALAAEIAKLPLGLPASGTAVLNADDPQVLAMAAQCRAKVITYGVSAVADLRADAVSSAWPERLRMTLHYQGAQAAVQTQLVGTHWLPSVLGAVGGGLAAGLSLQDCAQGLAAVPPFEGRMQPVTTPQGVTFIRDDFKAPLWTLEACFDFMRNATAKRKIIVIGELQEVGARKGDKVARAAQQALEVADVVVFVGPWASNALKVRQPLGNRVLKVFVHVRDAVEFVHADLQRGDLVLLKGANKQDHLQRMVLAATSDIACWRDDCQRNAFCSACPQRMAPSGPPLLAVPLNLVASQREQVSDAGGGERDLAVIEPDNQRQYIVGMGNPGAQFDNTPHNLGYAAVDAFAQAWQLAWQRVPEGWLALGQVQAHPVALVKIDSVMNLTGARLKQLADRLEFTPAQCILVFDDLDLPLGAVRARTRGSAGGHRGVASILEAFQTDAIRRVKLGVAASEPGVNRVAYVLRVFDANARPLVIQSLTDASAHVERLLGLTSRAARPVREPEI